jgi:hypothetical protein
MPPELEVTHSYYPTLKWLKSIYCTFEWDPTFGILMGEGLIEGKWTGDVREPPYKSYSLSLKGAASLKEYERILVVQATNPCTNGHYARYADEVYTSTDCTRCGRIFNPRLELAKDGRVKP